MSTMEAIQKQEQDIEEYIARERAAIVRQQQELQDWLVKRTTPTPIPKTIKVGPFVYDVMYPFQFAERSDVVGLTKPDHLKILISGYQDGQTRPLVQVWATLIHELLHAVDQLTGRCVFSHEAEGVDHVDAFAHGILGILIDNGWLTIPQEEPRDAPV